jgi:hypothetical protein
MVYRRSSGFPTPVVEDLGGNLSKIEICQKDYEARTRFYGWQENLLCEKLFKNFTLNRQCTGYDHHNPMIFAEHWGICPLYQGIPDKKNWRIFHGFQYFALTSIKNRQRRSRPGPHREKCQ